MSVGAEQQVFGLEVAVDDVERVEVVERERDLGRVEFGDRVGEALAEGRGGGEGGSMLRCVGRIETAYLTLSQQAKQFTAGHKIHDHVQVVDVSKCAPQVDQERMSHSHEHFPFRVGMLDLLHADDFFLVEDLDGVEATVVPGSNEVDTAKGARAEAIRKVRGQPLTESQRGTTYVLSIWKSFSPYLPAVLRSEGTAGTLTPLLVSTYPTSAACDCLDVGVVA